jgi:HD superfamily phosphohydrolase
MASSRDFRDPVHGFIRLHGRECDVVDTPIFQRLRRIKQLAMAHLVYPGAVHTRLEHTLGVLHVAGRLCSRLEIDAEATRIIRLAALLHDIGHGPFSHPSEEVLAELAFAEGLERRGETDKIHEVITREIIISDPALRKLISDRDREDIIKLLDKGWGQPLFKDIVSGPLDADKQDYLLRDSHHCGVRYGIYDISRFQDVLCRVSDESGDSLAVDEDGVNTLEQFVLARYYLTTQVITHKGRRISDAMLVRGLKLGVTVDALDFLRSLYRFKPGAAFIDEYVRWNDERLMSRLLEPEHETTWAGRFARRLADRRLLKIVFRRPITDFPDLVLDSDKVGTVAATIEQEVSGILGVAPEEVVFKVHRSPPTRKSEGPVLIAGRNGQPEPLESRSVIFRSVDQSLREEHLECYAPLDGQDDQSRRRALSDVDDAVVRQLSQLVTQPNLFGEGHGT